MAAGKDIELTTRAGEVEVDELAAQEAIEDERKKTEQQHHGGVLERYINLVSAINFSFVLQCSWELAASTFQFSLSNGGPASIVYGSIFSGIGSTLVAASLAEMASMDPTVGAQYRWSATLAPKWNRFFGLMQGWITVFGWIAACSSSTALISNVLVGLFIFNNPGYVPQRWHVTLLMWATTIFPLIANFWCKSMLRPLQAIGAMFHVVFFFVSLITMVVLARRSTADYVFNTLTNDISGWTNPAVAWGLGLLTVTYPISGFDAVLHMSDEVKKARVRVPRSMVLSVILNATMQFCYMLTVVFCIGDIDLVSGDFLPIIQVYYQATGSKHVTNLFVLVIGIGFLIAFFNSFASVSRLIWAFSRDNGLPFSPFFSRVHPKFKMPINALILIAVCLWILALVNLGSSAAFNAFISLPALGFYVSYFFPIFFLFCRRISRRHATSIPWGPFTLGAAGPAINLTAMCYLIFVIIWMPFPAVLPVDGINMNYAGPIFGAVVVGAVLDWCISGRRRFQVPVARHRPDLD